MADSRNTSPHILNTSSNLLGICFLVLTSLRVLKIQSTTWVDEFTSVAMILFMVSCFTSFLSIRSRTAMAKHYENIADICFLAGLVGLFGTTMLVMLNVIK